MTEEPDATQYITVHIIILFTILMIYFVSPAGRNDLVEGVTLELSS